MVLWASPGCPRASLAQKSSRTPPLDPLLSFGNSQPESETGRESYNIRFYFCRLKASSGSSHIYKYLSETRRLAARRPGLQVHGSMLGGPGQAAQPVWASAPPGEMGGRGQSRAGTPPPSVPASHGGGGGIRSVSEPVCLGTSTHLREQRLLTYSQWVPGVDVNPKLPSPQIFLEKPVILGRLGGSVG